MDPGAALQVVLVGLAVILAGLINAVFQRFAVPSLVGYLALGIAARLIDARWHFLTDAVRDAFSFLASVGVVVLLFRVGVESNIGALIAKLPRAVPVWVGNVALSAAAGFVAAFYGLGLSLVTAAVIATALTATSVGVSVAVWQDAGALNSGNGRLLIDVAELDDISGVALLTLLLALIPVLQSGGEAIWGAIAGEAGVFFVKLGVFTAVCVAFARYLERPLVRASARVEPRSGMLLTIVGFGLIIAAFAALLGLSLAIGALFAGFIFSREAEARKTEPAFDYLYAFFTPFFFIGIGLEVEPAGLARGLSLGPVLLAAALAGKLAGTMLPALLVGNLAGATLIGISMVPRAEVAMIVMHQARSLAPAAVPESVYVAMVLVAVVTSVSAPLALKPLLRRWPQRPERSA